MRFGRLIGVIAIASCLLWAGCGGDSEEPDAEGQVEAAATTTSTTDEIDNAWALDYVKGTEGPADTSQEPVKIAYINQQGGTVSFDTMSTVADAAVRYVNENLGGIGGRPLELVPCYVQSEEDGQKCGTELLNDDELSMGVEGLMTMGNGSLYETVKGKKPIILPFATTGPDIGATPGVYSYTASAPANAFAMAVAARDLDPKSISLLAADDAPGRLLQPALEEMLGALGSKAEIKAVYIKPNASAPEITSAIQSAGGLNSEVLMTFLIPPLCDALANGLQSLAADIEVIASGGCYDPMVMPEGDTLRDGWYFTTHGTIPYIPDVETGTKTYVDVMNAYDIDGWGDPQPPVFAAVMTAARLLNEVGPENITPEAIDKAAKEFTGPAMMVPGDVECGYDPNQPSICAKEVGIVQYRDGEWHEIYGAENGNAIDPTDPPPAG